MSALTLGKLGALADVTTILPMLTETELRRLLVLAKAMRSERSGHYRASTLAEETVGPLTALETVLDHLSDLDGLLGMGDELARLGPDESLSLTAESQQEMREVVARVATVLDALLAVDGPSLATLIAAMRAASDPPT